MTQIDSWQAAEEAAAGAMRSWGYQRVRLTPAGADAGVDVKADGALAQVKFEAHQVGRPVLHRLVGARGRSVDLELLVFSGAGYSKQAIGYADEMDIALFAYRLDGAMVPVNQTARQVAGRAPGLAGEAGTKPVSGAVPWRGIAIASYAIAALFAVAFLTGLFNRSNFESVSGVLAGLAMIPVVVVALWVGNLAQKQHKKQDVGPPAASETGR